MKGAATAAQMLLRLAGLAAIVLGVLFWTGTVPGLVPLHMLSGVVLVLCLWFLAGFAARAGAGAGVIGTAAVTGLLVVVLGVTQTQILLGPAHWVVQLVHLLLGVAAIGLGEALGAQIRRPASSTI